MAVDLGAWIWGRGRTPRGRYWFWLLSLMAAAYLAHVVAIAFAEARVLPIEYAGLVVLAMEVANAWLSIALSARRLHDIGRSGWWQVAPIATALTGLTLAEPSWAEALGLSETSSFSAGLVAFVAYISFLIALGIVRGAPADNRFGPRPAG